MSAESDSETLGEALTLDDVVRLERAWETLTGEDISAIEQAGEALMRQGDAKNAIALFALALRLRDRITHADRRERIERGSRGAWAESVAVTFLLERGYDVFRNVSPHGPIDLVAFSTDGSMIRFVDVKTSAPPRVGLKRYRQMRRTPEQIRLGVELLFVDPNGKCTWGKHDAP